MNSICKKRARVWFLTICLVTVLFLPFLTQAAQAETGIDQIKKGLDVSAGTDKGAGFPTDAAAKDLPTKLGKTINYGFGILGTIFLGIVLLGGFRWMTAGGNEEKVGKGKHMVIGGINGMIGIFLAYALVYVFLAALTAATG